MGTIVKILGTVATTFFIGFLAVLGCMLVFGLFLPHQFQPWLAAGIAAGGAIGWGIRSKWSLSPNVSIFLVALLIGVGDFIGHWLTVNA